MMMAGFLRLMANMMREVAEESELAALQRESTVLMQTKLKVADTFEVAMKEFEDEIASMLKEQKEHLCAYMQNILSIIYDHELHMYGGDTLDHKVGHLFSFLEVERSLEPLDHSLPTNLELSF